MDDGQNFESMRLSRVALCCQGNQDALAFIFKNGALSPKAGDNYEILSHLELQEQALKKITVYLSKTYLVGLKFTYANGQVSESKANFCNELSIAVDVDLAIGEQVVGVTLEYDSHPRKIGFTIMKTV